MKTKSIILFIIIMACAWIADAQSGSEFAIPFSDPAKRGKVKARLNYGSITIKGTARKDVLVKYSSAKDEDDGDHNRHGKNNNKDKDEGSSKDGLKKIGGGGLDLEASEANNLIRVESGSWSVKTNLEIEVPTGVDLQVSTYNDGDIVITNIQGELELKNYNGSITALSISGSVMATTYNGDIKTTFDKVTDATPMSYITYNGDVDLTFPATVKATFKMKTQQGDIYTGFDMTITTSGPEKQQDPKTNGYKLKIDEWKRGDVNGGGPEITLKNQNGDIFVRKK